MSDKKNNKGKFTLVPAPKEKTRENIKSVSLAIFEQLHGRTITPEELAKYEAYIDENPILTHEDV